MTWRKWPGANFSPGPRRDVSGHGSSVRPNEFNFIHIFLFVFHAHITIFLWETKQNEPDCLSEAYGSVSECM